MQVAQARYRDGGAVSKGVRKQQLQQDHGPACSRLEDYEITMEISCPIDVAATIGEGAREFDRE